MNWGKKLVIGMALFMIFIVSMGAVMIMRGDKDALVENDYYEKGQKFDETARLKQAAIDDMMVPTVSVSEYGVIIGFREPVKYQLTCKRPSDYHLDKIYNSFTDEDRSIVLMKGDLAPGPWMLSIRYTHEHKNYLYECEIVMP